MIQGITEFLPISSSGHLILLPLLTGWQDQGLAMDVAVHVGTLGAVLFYFWRDVLQMIKGFFSLLRGKVDHGGRMALQLALATIPAMVFGVYLSSLGMDRFRTFVVIGWTSIIYGILLLAIDRLTVQERSVKDVTYFKAFFIGVAQALALIPGTSRSGACMTMGRFFGLKRPDAARFAFLLAIPAIIAAASHTAYKAMKDGTFISHSQLLWGIGFSFVAGLLAINFMMKWLRSSDFKPFVIYRLCLGTLLLVWAYQGDFLSHKLHQYALWISPQ